MRRTCAVVALVFVVIGLGASFVRPQLSLSAVDRALRALALVDPVLARRLRENHSAPLEARLAARGFGLGDAAFIRIFKEENQLEVWLCREGSFTLFEAYPICSWSGALGPKVREGDGQSPEGFYAVGLKQLNPNSAYHRAFDLGFPNAYDRVHGRTGSYLMVHGDCLSVGCYAMRDGGIDEIYRVVEAALRAGQREVPVHAFPFRLSDEALARRLQHPAAAEWAGLKEGYDLFEATKALPAVAVCGGRYSFGPPPADCTSVTAW
jgi:murein L,D-transpeptidase YafK